MSNLTQLSRVYGDETWRVYDVLDQSLAPSGPDSLYDLAGTYLSAGSRILANVYLYAGTTLGERNEVHPGAVLGGPPQDLSYRGEPTQLVIGARCEVREGVTMNIGTKAGGGITRVGENCVFMVGSHVDGALRELSRVLNPGGHMLVYTTFVTDRLSDQERELFSRHLGNVPANLIEANVEDAFARAGFAIERKDVIGTEWRENIEEQGGTVSRAFLRLSRFRRQREELVQRFGRDICDSVEANLHWEIFQFLGKLLPVVYVLSRNG